MNKLFEANITRHVCLPYCEYLPKDYSETASRKWPLVIFLHGAGERGTDLTAVSRHGFPKYAAEGKSYPFVLLAPQCPNNHYWGEYIESLNDFLDFALEQYHVDIDRVYLTGLSMGGTGTWLWALGNPERFAAVAPVCGTGVYWYADRLVNMPVWAFHGMEDQTVLCSESRNMVDAINKHGGHARLTIYDGVGHNCWDAAYFGDSLANWLLEHERLH